MKSLVNNTVILLAALLFLLCPAKAQNQPPPCKCSCSGQIQCASGQWAYCECEKNKCSGECRNVKKSAGDLPASVLSVITGEEITSKQLREERERFAEILRRLLSNKNKDGVYTISSNGREIHFGFTDAVVRLLEAAQRDLENSR